MRERAALQQRLLVVAVVAALVTATMAAVIRLGTTESTVPEKTANPTGAAATLPTAPSPCAHVGEWEGKLAVFRGDESLPETVYDVYIASLPPAEQQALAARIPVFDEVELQSLLEDYTG